MSHLENKVLNGDQQAFKEWMDIHIRKIARFGVQYGVPPKEADNVAETVFREIFQNLSELTPEQLEEKALFKRAIQLMTSHQPDKTTEGLFSFEEDNELHRRVINIAEELRVPFILAQFQQQSISVIGDILDQSEQQVAQSIQEAHLVLDEPDLGKKLGFLKTSYDRLQPTYEESKILKTNYPDLAPTKEEKTKEMKRKPLLLWSLGVVILLALLFTSVVQSDAYQRSSSEKFIENLKKSFQQEVDDRLELIGLAQLEENAVNRFLEFYANNTNMAFTRFIATLEGRMDKDKKIDRKAAAKTYETLIQQLRLPSEMLEEVKENPLSDNREESIDFMEELYMKVTYLTSFYMGTLAEHEEIIWSSDSNDEGLVDIDRFLSKKSEYPLELQNIIDGMGTQSVYLTGLKDVAPLFPQYGTPEVSEVLKQNLHPDMGVYVYMLSGESNRVVYSGTIDEKMDALSYMEQELSKTKKSDELHQYLDNGYRWLFYTVTGVHEQRGIYDPNLSIKPEIRERWKHLASRDESNMIVEIMREIVRELEEQNWMSPVEYGVEQRLSGMLEMKLEEAREGNK